MPRLSLLFALLIALSACQQQTPATPKGASEAQKPPPAESPISAARLEIYTPVELTADLSQLSDRQRQMVGLLIDAADIMDGLFWRQAYGDPATLLDTISDPQMQRFARINYGPWDRLDGNQPFLPVGDKPPGAQFYPHDMSKAEFAAWDQPGKDGLYSLVRRDAVGQLHLLPYSEAFAGELSDAADLLRQAAELADHDGFARYLRLRADALLSDDYFASDMAWMENKDNPVELVLGPIETYEDQLFGYRAAFEGFVLIKDLAWSKRLARFAQYLPDLQRGLPVAPEYKAETPGSDADLNAYDVVYYAGDCNAGSKTIAINLPNDERVQLKRGTRRLQLKNAMRAKFDKILLPISEQLIVPEQRQHISFDAFFANTMFHEVAHGLGIKNTLNGRGSVRQTLLETASALEEGKADILGLYMIGWLHNKGELEGALMDNYVTFMAGIFRSVRFGATSAHGRANMIRFNYFQEQGAFSRDPESGLYRIDADALQTAATKLSELILTIQGDGDYQAARQLLDDKGIVGAQLAADLEQLARAGIPVDIVFDQGRSVLGL